MTAAWRSVALQAGHEIADFDCGTPTLNTWLVTQGLRAQVSDTARTYVWTEPESPQVKAYYSIVPTQVSREGLTRGFIGGVSVVPAYLLARLALGKDLHGQGLGAQLLLDAIGRIIEASKTAAGRLIVVDVIDSSAASFYRYHDFSPVSGDPRRLVLKISTARKAFDL